jgi:hypothetical protein
MRSLTDSWSSTLGAFALLAIAVIGFMSLPGALFLLLLVVLLLVGIFTRLGRRHS